MKKYLIILVSLVVISVGYFLISPLFREEKVDEKIEDISGEENVSTISEGTFEGLGAHNAKGTAKLIKIGDKFYVRFEDDFEVTNGPDLFVHFGKDGNYIAEARLGKLKGNIGGQNYEVLEGINPENFNEVWVWCRTFSTPFAKAVLNNII